MSSYTAVRVRACVSMHSRFHPLFWLLGIPEDLFADDPFRSFVKVRVEGILDLQKLRPERLIDE